MGLLNAIGVSCIYSPALTIYAFSTEMTAWMLTNTTLYHLLKCATKMIY
jgi:hypothetical protein